MPIATMRFSGPHHRYVLWGILALMMLVSAVSFWKYGPYFSPDTANYFLYAQDMEGKKQLYGTAYSPFYPWVIQWAGFLGIKQIVWASSLIVGIYLLQLFGIYKLGRQLHQMAKTTAPEWIVVVFLLIMLHVWWSFRLLNWAHADGLFYTAFWFWLLYGVRLVGTYRLKTVLIFSLISAGMIWIKLNAVMLLPFLAVFWCFDQWRRRWLLPFFTVLCSYWVYQKVFPGNLFSTAVTEFSPTSTGTLLANYVADTFRVSAGFVFSDYLTAQIPDLMAFPAGILLLGGLLYGLRRWQQRRERVKFFLWLFGLTYLGSFLTFQWVIGFEEINYRTLFPYFWTLMLALMFYLLERACFKMVWVQPLAFLLLAHTLAGHYLYAQKDHQNSLFKAKALLESELLQEIRAVTENSSSPYVLYADHPELLSFVMENRPVLSPAPECYFRAGKSRPLPLEEQQALALEFQDNMKKGRAILVLFRPWEWKESVFEAREAWHVRHFQSGKLIYAKVDRD